ncbi:MAG: aldo/keto reductase, partial [Anaerolineae bacterium]|nr:aldo/keto reductase [Anaerolineae bacterium]
MRLGGSWGDVPVTADDRKRAVAAVAAALENGINFFDHADIYGSPVHGCEARFAEALQLTPSQRAEITLQSKAGIVTEGPYFDFSYDHIIEAVHGSLAALRTDYLDILLL